jgi:16S rRNA (cytosine967-C5)-methyltransferase
MPDTPKNARKEAAAIISKWLADGTYLDRLIPPAVQDRGFVVETTYGIVRHMSELEWIARRLSSGNPKQQVMPYLLVGLYQVFMMDNVEEYALVDETVEAVREAGMQGLTGYVNGVLRNALRQKKDLLMGLDRQKLSIRHSHPEILIRRWTSQHGEAKAAELCQWNNSRPGVTLRVCRMKTSVGQMLDKLHQAGAPAKRNELMPDDCIDIGPGQRVTDLPGFSEGHFMVQDASTLVSVKMLAPLPGTRVIDACAAPGGKAMHIAELMEGTGEVVAVDSVKDRLEAVEANAARMGFRNIRPVTGDASDSRLLASYANGGFDAVLLDAPCTNTGVLRRRPEAKWRFTKDSLLDSANLQRKLLDACAGAVRPGGRLVYSICSLEPEEGETLIERFINSNRSFSLAGSKYILPPGRGSDGGYCALLIRSNDK